MPKPGEGAWIHPEQRATTCSELSAAADGEGNTRTAGEDKQCPGRCCHRPAGSDQLSHQHQCLAEAGRSKNKITVSGELGVKKAPEVGPLRSREIFEGNGASFLLGFFFG